jgi:AbrB family looped-hinge helix DNA binding protein
MGISKITRNYQVTLPKDVRELKNLKEGDRVIFAIEGDKIDIVKFDKATIRATAGLWKGMKETGVEYQRRLRKGWSKRLEREYGARQ